MVRLKGPVELKSAWSQNDLHSTMVRLKGEVTKGKTTVPNSFTFHYGQIKRKTIRGLAGRKKDIYIPLWSD